MSYSVQQGNIFGRIGSGIGKGLADTLPKEIERTRLATGLKELGEQKDLTPFQQLAGFYGIPGAADRPELIRSGTDFLRQQMQRQAYNNRAGAQPNQSPNAQQPLSQVEFANLNQRQQPGSGQNEPTPQGNYPAGEPQIVEKNPLSPEFQNKIPWTPEQRDNEVQRVWNQFPYFTKDEVLNQVADNERRYLESPKAYQEEQKRLEEVQNNVNTEIESQLRKKLHIPAKDEVFSKLPGESINRIERGVARDLKKNPQANVKDLVNTWTDRALENEKSKSELSKLANRDLSEKIFKTDANLSKLKSMSQSFKQFGNSEEFYNFLRTPNKRGVSEGFGLSPEGAASIAYPLSKSAQEYLNKIKPSHINLQLNSSKYAHELEDYLTRDDSILSIAKNLKEKDPTFNSEIFLNEVRKIQDELGLSPFQKRELETRGTFDFFPNWGDVFLFPRAGKGL